MFADTHQTRTLEVARSERSVKFGVMAGWLIVGLAVTSLLAGLIGSYTSLRYPGAARQTPAELQFPFQPTGIFSQQSAYQTPDDLPQVLGWYTQHFGLGHERPQGENCVTMNRGNQYLVLQQSLTVTLCSQSTRTLIFINRSLALH
jgi:hypothetical protein